MKINKPVKIVGLIVSAGALFGMGACSGAMGASADTVVEGYETGAPVDPTVTEEPTVEPTDAGEPGMGEADPEPTEETEPTEEPVAATYKAKVVTCERGEYGDFDVTVKVTNLGDVKTDYWFDIGLYDKKGNTVGSGSGSVEVKPGKSGTTETFASLSDPDFKGKTVCEVEITDF